MMTPDHTGYAQMIDLLGAKLLAAIPKNAGPVGINALLNAATSLLAEGSPSYRQEQMALSIAFFIGEARRLGVNLDDLARHCQQLATDHDRVFYNVRS